ncbi:MAG: DUF3333 domain-containing protein, partial [Chromatiales bacterium]
MNNATEVRHQAKVRVQQGLTARYRAERRFQFYGKLAIGMGLLFLSLLFFSILSNGLPAFQQTYMALQIHFDPEYIDPQGDGSLASLADGNYGGLVKDTLRKRFPTVSNRREKRALYSIVSRGAAYQLRDMLLADPQLLGTRVEVWVPADDELDMLIKGHTTDIDRETGRGILSLVGNDEEVTLLSTSNDFSNILQDVKRSIGRDADRSERKLERLQNNLSDAEKALTGLEERMLEARNDPLQNAG